jgi:hypothetical protein
VTQLCYEVDTEPYAALRDTRVAQLASDAGVQVAPFVSHTLYVSAPIVIAPPCVYSSGTGMSQPVDAVSIPLPACLLACASAPPHIARIPSAASQRAAILGRRQLPPSRQLCLAPLASSPPLLQPCTVKGKAVGGCALAAQPQMRGRQPLLCCCQHLRSRPSGACARCPMAGGPTGAHCLLPPRRG